MKLYCLSFLIYINCVFAVKLARYNIDRNGITAGGASSGGAMATQLHVAYSSIINGVAVIAGPPYYCARGSLITATVSCATVITNLFSLQSTYKSVTDYEKKGLIDNVSNMKDDKVYVFSGTLDPVAATSVVKKNEEFYENYVSNPSTQIRTIYNMPTTHGFITNGHGLPCSVPNPWSFLNDCGWDQAHDVLKHMYGPSIIEPLKNSKAEEKLIEFEQKEFFAGNKKAQLDDYGYLYVPKRCAQGNLCKLHILFHGCLQGRYRIGSDLADFAGYNEVADLNDIIILYPQGSHALLSNPQGCWDWWGFTSDDYANKNGLQLKAVKGMIDRLVGI